MKKLTALFLALVFLLPVTALAKKTDAGEIPQYQIEGAGVTSQSAQQVRITIVTKKKENVTDRDLQKAAVHGVLFRDYDDASSAGYGSVASYKAIMGSPSAEAEYVDFFKPFFTNGDYESYCQLVGDSRQVVKVGKEWKVSAIVRVNTHALKKDLKKQGMIKNLGTGW